MADEIALHGVMKQGLGDDYCELVPESPLPQFQPSVLRNKIRVAVSASGFSFHVDQPRAYAGVDSPPIPH